MALRSRRLRTLPATIATVCVAVLVTGCGGGPGGSVAPAGAPSADAYPTADAVSAIAADPALHAELPADARTSGTITLGTTFNPGTSGLPRSGTDPGGAQVGLDVDLRNAVAKVLGITWNVQNGTFATIIPGVQNGRFAVGQDNFGVTKAREQVVDFATYLADGQAFLGAQGVAVDKVASVADLCGMTLATSPGSTFQQILETNAGACATAGKQPYTVQYFADPGPIFLGLANGKVDVYFGPTLSLRYDAAHVPNTKFLGQISSTPVGFVTAKGSPLAKAVSDAVNELIADGDYQKIFDKWSVGTSGVSKSEVNPTATL